MRRAAALALLLAGCGSPSNEPVCPHDPSFDRSGVIKVRTDTRPVVLRRDLDLAAIAAKTEGSGAGKTQGLTEVGNQLDFRTLVRVETARGRSCVWFDEVRIDLTPASVQVFVPREYPEHSCESLAVLEHENEHVRVHREGLEKAAEDIRAALIAAKWLPARGNPLETDDRAAAEAALEAKIRKVVTPAYDKYKEDMRAAQAELDKPELYQWATKRCTGWK